jgi:hypothetical protein
MLKGDAEKLREKGLSEEEIAKKASDACPDNELFKTPEDIKDQMLNTADGPNAVAAKIDVGDLTYQDLKAKCKDLGLKVSGKKDELVARIQKHLGGN